VSNYEYKYTEENGYKQMYLSKENHALLFPKRKCDWRDSYQYLVSFDRIVVEKHVSWLAVIAVFLLLPIHILLHGITNAKEVWAETIECIPYYAKKRGSFSSDVIFKGDKMFDKFMEMAKE